MVSKPKNNVFFIALAIVLILSFSLDLVLGSVMIPVRELLAAFQPGGESNAQFILFQFRLPKAITSLLVGAGLSLAGLLMQTLFRNPLAGPYVLGISSGASLGVAVFVMTAGLGGMSMAGYQLVSSIGIVGAAIAGSVLVMMLVIAVSIRVSDSVSILIIGIMFGSITGAVVSVISYFSDPDSVHSFLVWTYGSVADVSWNQLLIIAPLTLLGIGVSFGLLKPLNGLILGENYAKGIGINVRTARMVIILLTGIMAGGLTAFTGPIAFIGVAVPHLARNVFKTNDHRVLVPAVLLIGSILMLICDVISQLPGSNQLLPINSVTALFGAPVVIWVIARNRNKRGAF